MGERGRPEEERERETGESNTEMEEEPILKDGVKRLAETERRREEEKEKVRMMSERRRKERL